MNNGDWKNGPQPAVPFLPLLSKLTPASRRSSSVTSWLLWVLSLRTMTQDVQQSEVILSYLASWKLPWATGDSVDMSQSTMGHTYANRLLGL